jgi:cysteine-rich repeat protein
MSFSLTVDHGESYRTWAKRGDRMKARRSFLVAVCVWAFARAASAGFTEIVSVGVDGWQSYWDSQVIGISADGRLVAFSTQASDLPSLNAPAGSGTFIRDRHDATTVQAYASTFSSRVSAVSSDMRVVVVVAFDDPLLPEDTNGANDVYVIDRTTNTIARVSVASDGTQADGDSSGGSISANGRTVAFVSTATNLVPNDTNSVADVFVHDLDTGITERVSVATDGSEGDHASGTPNGFPRAPVLSADGRMVAFISNATNLAPGATDGDEHAFLHDRLTGTTELVSILPDGSPYGHYFDCCDLSLSADARYVAFNYSPNTGLDQVMLRDRVAGTTERVSDAMDATIGNGSSGNPSLSADARFVAFASTSSDLVPGDTNGATDIFVRDRLLGTTERVDVTTAGAEPQHGAGYLAGSGPLIISGDGRVVAFTTSAVDLVAADRNAVADVFTRDRTCGNGTVEGTEECDDGNNVDGDGCDANCTITRCGNGQRTAGEACDDGTTNGSDGCCTSGCALVDGDGDGRCDANDRCTTPPVTKARLDVRGITPYFYVGLRVTLKGRMAAPLPTEPPLDPLADGVRLLVTDDIGRVDIDQTIPGGGYDSTSGWVVKSPGAAWRYTDKRYYGFHRVNIRRDAGTVTFSVVGNLFRGSNNAFDPSPLPLHGFLYLHPPLGSCGEAIPPTCQVLHITALKGFGDRVSCR